MSVDLLHPDPWTNHRALVAALLAVAFIMAIAARRLMLRASTVPRNDLEERAWSYCPRCGLARGGQDDIGQARDTRYLPSALLCRGWCREPALDADGRVVLPGDPAAVAFSLWGAANRAFDPGSSPWQAWIEHLDRILCRRYGETIGGRPMTVQRWNRDPSRTQTEVVGIAMEVERVMARDPPRRI